MSEFAVQCAGGASCTVLSSRAYVPSYPYLWVRNGCRDLLPEEVIVVACCFEHFPVRYPDVKRQQLAAIVAKAESVVQFRAVEVAKRQAELARRVRETLAGNERNAFSRPAAYLARKANKVALEADRLYKLGRSGSSDKKGKRGKKAA